MSGFRPLPALLFMFMASTLFMVTSEVNGQETSSVLPFSGTDVVYLLDESGLAQKIGGAIQTISGERVTIRRSGSGDIRVLRLSEIEELSFQRSAGWEQGLEQFRDGSYRDALASFDGALVTERRDWAWCELQSTAVRTLIRLRQYKQAVDRIELILEKDPSSRHVSLLPLTWDERLSPEEKVPATPEELRAESVVRRLVAASALLHLPRYRVAAKSTLDRIRQTEGLSRKGEMARCQLWRLHLLEHPQEQNPVLSVWADRVREMPVEARFGPQYVVARGLRRNHDYDGAALAFLWMPLMSADDAPLAALSLAEAIQCLKLAGRIGEAEQMERELKTRFAGTTAADAYPATDRAQAQPLQE